MTLRHEKRFESKGYNLEKFLNSDTRRIESDGTIYKYYAAQDGRIVEKFENSADAGQWIEVKEMRG